MQKTLLAVLLAVSFSGSAFASACPSTSAVKYSVRVLSSSQPVTPSQRLNGDKSGMAVYRASFSSQTGAGNQSVGLVQASIKGRCEKGQMESVVSVKSSQQGVLVAQHQGGASQSLDRTLYEGESSVTSAPGMPVRISAGTSYVLEFIAIPSDGTLCWCPPS